jgi:hypothetical protein
MAEEIVKLLTGIAGGPSTDGKAIVIEWGIDKENVQFAIPLQDVPTVIGVMLRETIRASEKLSPKDRQAIAESPQKETPRVTSFALGPSDVAQHETLYIRFGIVEIRVLIRVDQMVDLAEAIAGPKGKRH